METLAMGKRERRRWEVLSQVVSQQLTLQKSSELLGIGYRQMKRLWSRYQAEGDAGLVHRLRGRKSNRRGDTKLWKRVLARYLKQYGDYGPTLAAECLAEEGLVVPVQTRRRWLLAVQEERVVQNDWTVRWNHAFLQLPRGSGMQPGQRVTVCDQLDGRVRLFSGDRELAYGTTRTDPRPQRQRVQPRSGPTKSIQGLKPAQTHPWRGRGQPTPTPLCQEEPQGDISNGG